MKKKLTMITFFFFLASLSLEATITRVKSLGDIEDPVTGMISGLIKDDIVDIYFNPARVNDVKAFMVLMSGNFHNGYADDTGTAKDETWEYIKIIEGITTNKSKVDIDRKGYDFNFNTGVLIPLSFFNLFISYNPVWNRDKEDYVFDSNTASQTDALIKTYSDSSTKSTIPFEVTLGFNIKDVLMLGLRAGYFNTLHNQYYRDENDKVSKKGEFNEDRFLLGAGVKFNFMERISLSFVADFEISQKDESPLMIENGFSGAGSYNYDSIKSLYQYITREQEASYHFRLIPELELNKAQDMFIRIILEMNVLDYQKSYNFNDQGALSNYEMSDFKKNRYMAGLGASYNHALSKSTKGVYGIKYSGLLKGLDQYKFYENKSDKTRYKEYKELDYEHFLGLFAGFDIEITKYLFLRTGLSQGIYRKQIINQFDRTMVLASETLNETDQFREEYLPDTVFCIGFYLQPIKDLTLEFNFNGSQDWDFQNVSRFEEVKKENGIMMEKTTTRNWDFNLGASITYKI